MVKETGKLSTGVVGHSWSWAISGHAEQHPEAGAYTHSGGQTKPCDRGWGSIDGSDVESHSRTDT